MSQPRRPTRGRLPRPRDHRPPATTDAMASHERSAGGTAETKAENDFAALKAQVHNTLLQQLGPKLYDAELTQTELEPWSRARCRRPCRPRTSC